jgi:hypothetical protein
MGSFVERRPRTAEEKKKRTRNSDIGGISESSRKRKRMQQQLKDMAESSGSQSAQEM